MADNNSTWVYQCTTCKHNHNIYHHDNFHSTCPQGHCVLCIWKHERTCADYEEGETIEISDDED